MTPKRCCHKKVEDIPTQRKNNHMATPPSRLTANKQTLISYGGCLVDANHSPCLGGALGATGKIRAMMVNTAKIELSEGRTFGQL